MTSAIRRISSWGLIVLLAGIGCAGSEPPPSQNPPVQTDSGPIPPNPQDQYMLTLVGWQNVQVQQGQQTTLQVRYTKNNQSVVGEAVQFSFKGDSKDSVVSSFTGITNSQGFAQTVLTGGQLLATFQVEATAAYAGAVFWNVEVQEKSITPPNSVKMTGTFELESGFDIQGNFDGSKLASALNIINDFSDEPQDPGKFLVDMIVDEIAKDSSNSWINTVKTLLKYTLYDEANKLVNSMAPTLVPKFKQMGQDLSTVARKFQLTSRMVSPTPQEGDRIMTVDHTLDKIGWNLNGNAVEYSFLQLGQTPPVANGLQITPINSTDYAIAQHSFNFKFGAFLLVALENLIIPMLDKNASSVTDLLAGQIQCTKVGEWINSKIGLGGQALWTSACNIALTSVGEYVNARIIDIDKDNSVLTIAGQTKILDSNHDAFFDQMINGYWTGSFQLNTAVNTVAGLGNTFTATRTQ
ncbi:MAG: hypothetical protein V1754_03920 [Pseudomonadota bacterium]